MLNFGRTAKVKLQRSVSVVMNELIRAAVMLRDSLHYMISSRHFHSV